MISILRILTRGGEGVQNLENLADVIYERPLCCQPKTYPNTTRYDFTKKARVRAYQLQVIFPSVYILKLRRDQITLLDENDYM